MTLKCLRVTSLKVEVQEWGCGAGRRRILRNRVRQIEGRKPKTPPSGTRGRGTRAKRLDVVAQFFNLFNRANVSKINPVFGSGLTPIPGFRLPLAGTGARQIQFSLDFEF